jgi:hypothetical protein
MCKKIGPKCNLDEDQGLDVKWKLVSKFNLNQGLKWKFGGVHGLW